MKVVLEVIPRHFEYDDTASPQDNDAIKRLFSLSAAEYSDILITFWHIIKYCGLTDVVKIQDWGDRINVIGAIPDDVLTMLEDVLADYTNDTVDKLDYAIGLID